MVRDEILRYAQNDKGGVMLDRESKLFDLKEVLLT